MKKIWTLASLMVGLTFGANAQAQRDCDMLSIVTLPTKDPAVTLRCGTTDSLALDFKFVNLGPHTLVPKDTIGIQYPGAPVGMVALYPLEDTLAVNDTIRFVFKLAYSEIEKFYNGDNEEVAKADFVSGTTYACVIGIDQFGSFLGDEINDSDFNNNFDAGAVKIDCTTGIKGLTKNNSSLKVFPNPAYNQVSFTNDFATATTASVRITDIAGRVVKTMDLGKQNAGAKTYNIDIADLNNGMYYLELVTEDSRSISKFTKN